ncbi:immunity 49 family protein [Streptomyces tubercidicus]
MACRVGTLDEVRKLPATGPQDYLHAGNWLTSFYLAVICCENERAKQLAQIPVEFLRASGTEFDDYVYAWIETLQHFWFGRSQAWETLVTAVQGTAPENARISDSELLLKSSTRRRNSSSSTCAARTRHSTTPSRTP